MGWGTAIFAAASIASARSTTSAAKAEAKAVVQQGTLAAKNKALETVAGTARLRSSFLNSGLTLEGTPNAVINAAYTTGLEDIGQISKNANTKSKNIMSAARTKAITQLISAASGAAGSSFGFGDSIQSGISSAASYLPESAISSINELGFGDTAFNALMKRDARADAGEWVGL